MEIRFSPRVDIVLRAVTDGQAQATRMFAGEVLDGTVLFFAAAHEAGSITLNTVNKRHKEIAAGLGRAQRIVDELVWRNLAQQYGDGMVVSEHFADAVAARAEVYANRLNGGLPDRYRGGHCLKIAAGFTGLHAALVGFEQLEANPGKRHFNWALGEYNRRILLPCATTTAAA